MQFFVFLLFLHLSLQSSPLTCNGASKRVCDNIRKYCTWDGSVCQDRIRPGECLGCRSCADDEDCMYISDTQCPCVPSLSECDNRQPDRCDQDKDGYPEFRADCSDGELCVPSGDGCECKKTSDLPSCNSRPCGQCVTMTHCAWCPITTATGTCQLSTAHCEYLTNQCPAAPAAPTPACTESTCDACVSSGGGCQWCSDKCSNSGFCSGPATVNPQDCVGAGPSPTPFPTPKPLQPTPAPTPQPTPHPPPSGLTVTSQPTPPPNNNVHTPTQTQTAGGLPPSPSSTAPPFTGCGAATHCGACPAAACLWCESTVGQAPLCIARYSPLGQPFACPATHPRQALGCEFAVAPPGSFQHFTTNAPVPRTTSGDNLLAIYVGGGFGLALLLVSCLACCIYVAKKKKRDAELMEYTEQYMTAMHARSRYPTSSSLPTMQQFHSARDTGMHSAAFGTETMQLQPKYSTRAVPQAAYSQRAPVAHQRPTSLAPPSSYATSAAFSHYEAATDPLSSQYATTPSGYSNKGLSQYDSVVDPLPEALPQYEGVGVPLR